MSVPVPDPTVVVASPADAPAMVEVIHAAFGARPALDPPSTASAETAESVAAALQRGGGIYAHLDGRPAGTILVGADPHGVATFTRVSVHPDHQRHGIASAMVTAAEDLAALQGCHRVELFAREELTDLIAFWVHRGFTVDRPAPHGVVLAKSLPQVLRVPRASDMQALGARLAEVLDAGDVLVLNGELGAGKTTLTQGLGAALGVSAAVISPTFVLSRVHRTAPGRPSLVHVDAYRLSTSAELDDLDLDASAVRAVTVVEWGRGLVEDLWSDRLELDILRHRADDARVVLVRTVGPRWHGVDLTSLEAGFRAPERSHG